MLSYFIDMDKVGVDDEEVVEEEGALVLSAEDTQMVARWVLMGGNLATQVVPSLTERLVRSIRVEQSVVRKDFSSSKFTICFNLKFHALSSVYWELFCKYSRQPVTWVR